MIDVNFLKFDKESQVLFFHRPVQKKKRLCYWDGIIQHVFDLMLIRINHLLGCSSCTLLWLR